MEPNIQPLADWQGRRINVVSLDALIEYERRASARSRWALPARRKP